MKKVLAVISIILVLLSSLSVAVVAASNDENEGIAPCYNNTNVATALLTINSSGRAQVSLHCMGISGVTTKIIAESKIQKKFGLIWINVSDAEWTDTAYSFSLNKTHYYQLEKSGTYRVKVTYTVSGSGGSNDSITLTCEDTY